MILLAFFAQINAEYIFGCSVNLNETSIIKEVRNGNLNFDKCTHIKIGTAVLGQDSTSLAFKLEGQVKLLGSLVKRLKKKYTAKILLQLELTYNAVGLKQLLHTTDLVDSFAQNVDFYLEKYGFDGIDIMIRRLPTLSSLNRLLGVLRNILNDKTITLTARDKISMSTRRSINGIPDEFIPQTFNDFLGNFTPDLCGAVDFVFINLFYSPGRKFYITLNKNFFSLPS